MKLLHTIYVRTYQLMVDIGNADIASFASLGFMTINFSLNLMTVLEILDILGYGIDQISKVATLIAAACIFGGLYLALVHEGRAVQILAQYKDETKRSRLKGRIALIVYLVLSIGLLVSVWMFMAIRNRT